MKAIVSEFIKIKINPSLSLFEIFKKAESKFLTQNKKSIRIVLIKLKKNWANFLISYIYEKKGRKR